MPQDCLNAREYRANTTPEEKRCYESSRALGAVCAVLACVPASAGEPPKGSIMLAKTRPNVILIWDATPAVIDLVNAKKPADEALHALEADALGIMAARSQGQSAQIVSDSVVYQRIEAVNPKYASATLQGLEKLFTLEAPRADVAKHGRAWKEQLSDGTIPSGVTVTVTGKLPGS